MLPVLLSSFDLCTSFGNFYGWDRKFNRMLIWRPCDGELRNLNDWLYFGGTGSCIRSLGVLDTFLMSGRCDPLGSLLNFFQ